MIWTATDWEWEGKGKKKGRFEALCERISLQHNSVFILAQRQFWKKEVFECRALEDRGGEDATLTAPSCGSHTKLFCLNVVSRYTFWNFRQTNYSLLKQLHSNGIEKYERYLGCNVDCWPHEGTHTLLRFWWVYQRTNNLKPHESANVTSMPTCSNLLRCSNVLHKHT